jgi:FlaA1/EpsC-like NDP-sugar epimerase
MVVSSDIISTAFSYWLAYLLRFNFQIPEAYYVKFFESLPVLVVIRMICSRGFRLYGGVWRYSSMNDLLRIFKAVTLGSVLFGLFVALRYQLVGFPRSVIIIDWFAIIIFLGGTRFIYRLLRESRSHTGEEISRVLIIGADDTGEMLLREMKQHRRLGYRPVGFLDNDAAKKGKRIHDVPILGKIDDIGRIAEERNIDEVIVASRSITGFEMRKIIEKCDQVGVTCKTVPALGDILNGKVSVRQIREIRIEDLLGREHIELDRVQIGDYLADKKVMVTGAAGSIGRELCRQILRVKPRELILFERVENELFHLQIEFAEEFPGVPYVPILGDILDVKRLERAMEDHRPDVVFHAAAYKHVPMMEAHPLEAVKNNIIGTSRVAEASAKYGVKKFVLISTDKAVKPANVMGATKRIAELVCQGMNGHSATKFVVVRFGNVLNSAGSVIPLFKEQIAKGGPVKVTHQEATRYFMSIPEAAQLVMQAGAMGRGGEIYVLDMGEPVRITDLATDMVRLMGLKVGEDIDIVYSGLRPGEKIHEELSTDEEEVEPTGHEKIMMVKSPPLDRDALGKGLEDLIARFDILSPDEIRQTLFAMIPENNRNSTSSQPEGEDP